MTRKEVLSPLMSVESVGERVTGTLLFINQEKRLPRAKEGS